MTAPYAGVRYEPTGCSGHVESSFVKANDPERPRAVWLKATIFASAHDPRRAVAESWAVAFDSECGHVAVKTWVPYDQARFSACDLRLTVDGCTFDDGRLRGAVVTGDRRIGWDLSWRDESAPLVHFPRAWMYEARIPSSKLVTLAPDARFSGRLDVNGDVWTLAGWPGMVGHNWGRSHAPRYAWGHCNAWEGRGEDTELVFEGLSAQVPVGPTLSPTTTLLCVRHRGVRYDLNGALDLVRSRGEISPRRWRFRGRNSLASVEGELWGETDDFVGLHYPNPGGPMTYCLNTKLAHFELRFRPRDRGEILLRSRAAALEIGTRNPDHGVRMYV